MINWFFKKKYFLVKMKQLDVKRKIKFKTEYIDQDGFLGTGFKFGEYYIKYLNDGQVNACSWQLLKRKKTVPLELNRNYDIGYVDHVKVKIGKDRVGKVMGRKYYKPPEDSDTDEEEEYSEEGWYKYERYGIVKEGGTPNTVSVTWDDGDKKLVFFNFSDKKNTKLVITRGEKLIFESNI